MTHHHANISIFVPHIGCPNKCSFCNQKHITGVINAPDAKTVALAVNEAKKSPKYNPNTTQIAFFGGSFTAIDRCLMVSLLEAAFRFVKNGDVSGIRISTRPDAINEEILTLLKAYGVEAIELGAQSLDDTVLALNNRGHNAKQVVSASNLIKKFGFELGLQIMLGLYGDNEIKALKTASKIIEIKPDTVRIYPTIVLKDTDLAELYLNNKYEPLNLENAVNLSARLYQMFTQNDIKVIRLGLHTIEQSSYLAGPWHPAFSELCLSKIMLDKALEVFTEKGKYIIYVSPTDVSKMTGQRRSNLKLLEDLDYFCVVRPLNSLKSLELKIERYV